MASTFSYSTIVVISCSTSRDGNDQNKQNMNTSIKNINGSSTFPFDKVKLLLNQKNNGTALAAITTTTTSRPTTAENLYINKQEVRQNIPTKKQLVDPFRQGLIIEGGVGYRQTIVIRSYEVGPDKTATIETILNLLQVN